MATEKSELKTIFSLSGEQKYKDAIKQINNEQRDLKSSLKLVQTELKALSEEEKGSEKHKRLLKEQTELLAKQYENQKRKVEEAKNALAQANRHYGEGSEEARKYKRELEYAEGGLVKFKEQVKASAEELAKQESRLLKASEAMGKAGDKMNKVGDFMTKGLTAPIAGAAAGIAKLSIDAGKTADDLITFANKTGLSAERVQELGYAARFIDTDLETMTGSIVKLTRNMDAASQGSKKQEEAFRQLGIEYKNADGSLRDANDVFMSVIDALGGMQNETERNALAMTLFGKSAQELNPLINAGSAELARYSQEAHDMGAVLDGESIQALGRLDDKMQQLDAKWQTAKMELGAAAAPLIEKGVGLLTNTVIPALKEEVDWFDKLPPSVQENIVKWGAYVAAAGPVIKISGNVATGISKVSEWLGKMKARKAAEEMTGLGNAAEKAAGGIGKSGASLSSFATYAGAAIGVVALVVAAINKIKNATTSVTEETAAMSRSINDMIISLKAEANAGQIELDTLTAAANLQADAEKELMKIRTERAENDKILKAEGWAQHKDLVVRNKELERSEQALNESLTKLGETTKTNTALADEFSREQQKLQNALGDTATASNDVTDSVGGMAEAVEEDTAAMEEALQRQLEAYQNHLAAMNGARIKQNEQTAAEMQADAEANNATYEAYYANRLTIQQKLQAEEFDALREHLLSLGVENTAQLDEIINMSDEELQGYAETFRRNMDSARIYADEGMMSVIAAISDQLTAGGVTVGEDAAGLNAAIIGAFSELGAELDLATAEGIAALAQSIADNSELPEEEARALKASIIAILGGNTSEAKNGGIADVTAYTEGVTEAAPNAKAEAQRARAEAQGMFTDAGTGNPAEGGKADVDAYKGAIEQNKPGAVAAAEQTKKETTAALEGSAEAGKKGSSLSSAFTDMIDKGKTTAKIAGNALATETLFALQNGLQGGHTTKTPQQMGADTVNSLLAGLNSRIGDLQMAGINAAMAYQQGYSSGMQQHSPSRVMIEKGAQSAESAVIGMRQGIEAMRQAGSDLALAGQAGYGTPQYARGTVHESAGGVQPAMIGGGITVNIGKLPDGMGISEGRRLGRIIGDEIAAQTKARGVRY